MSNIPIRELLSEKAPVCFFGGAQPLVELLYNEGRELLRQRTILREVLQQVTAVPGDRIDQPELFRLRDAARQALWATEIPKP